ncbi:MAG: nuclease-related domain-containing protein [Lysobacter sp.]
MTHLILIAAILLPALIVIGMLFVWRFIRRRDRRKSPLTFNVLNLPGEGLRRSIEKHDEGFHEKSAVAMLVGPVVLAAWLLARMDRVVKDWSLIQFGVGDAIFALVGLAMLAWSAWGLIHHASQRRKYVQGRAAELAVAQCLMPLMADGALVYHDLPADNFNIDHIVIGQGAVFAVETKSRRKPAEGGRDSARVDYDGTRLRFPKHVETKPIEQARRQAQWLARFLESGVGEPVRVIPVLALPGWYTQNSVQRPDVLVTNCHNPGFMVSSKFGEPFSPAMRKRIAHVLTRQYPPMEDTGGN